MSSRTNALIIQPNCAMYGVPRVAPQNGPAMICTARKERRDGNESHALARELIGDFDRRSRFHFYCPLFTELISKRT